MPEIRYLARRLIFLSKDEPPQIKQIIFYIVLYRIRRREINGVFPFIHRKMAKHILERTKTHRIFVDFLRKHKHAKMKTSCGMRPNGL